MIMFLCRVLAFKLLESPKYLLSRGQSREAAKVLKELAQRNGFVGNSDGVCRRNRIVNDEEGMTSTEDLLELDVDELVMCMSFGVGADGPSSRRRSREDIVGADRDASTNSLEDGLHQGGDLGTPSPSWMHVVGPWWRGDGAYQRLSMSRGRGGRARRRGFALRLKKRILVLAERIKKNVFRAIKQLKPLFSKSMAKTTTLVWIIWALVALGYTAFNGFLPKFLALQGGQDENSPPDVDKVYWDYFLVSLSGIPGSVIGAWAVETSFGRRGTMATATLCTALSMFLFSVALTPSGSRSDGDGSSGDNGKGSEGGFDMFLFAACVAAVFQNVMYGVLYSYTPEVFPAKLRGTATGIASSLSRITGTIAPLLTGYLLSFSVHLPLYFATAVIGVSARCTSATHPQSLMMIDTITNIRMNARERILATMLAIVSEKYQDNLKGWLEGLEAVWGENTIEGEFEDITGGFGRSNSI
ncbi:hypothetical protein HK102_007787 [Quaeritorhiza haematococci]|nr:hypothetical protein HK102_007787 [Quaeritorhiza haematococci]